MGEGYHCWLKWKLRSYSHFHGSSLLWSLPPPSMMRPGQPFIVKPLQWTLNPSVWTETSFGLYFKSHSNTSSFDSQHSQGLSTCLLCLIRMNSRAKGEKSPVIPAFSPTISLLSYLTPSGGSRQPMAALMGNRTGGSISVSPWQVQAPSCLSMEAPHTLGPVTLSRQWHTTPYLHLSSYAHGWTTDPRIWVSSTFLVP